MAEYIDKEDIIDFLKGIEALHYNDKLRINILNGINAISSTTDVVEREKIDKAIDEVYKIRNEVLFANGCYEPDDVLDIID